MKPLSLALLILATLFFVIAAFNQRVTVKFEWLGFACLSAVLLIERLG